MRRFNVNGKEYVAKKFDFNTICDLEDMGISMDQAKDKPMSMIRAYFAICANSGSEYAGNEMGQHLMNGGTFEDIMIAMSGEMEDSDFFRSISKTEKTETSTNTKKTSKAKS